MFGSNETNGVTNISFLLRLSLRRRSGNVARTIGCAILPKLVLLSTMALITGLLHVQAKYFIPHDGFTTFPQMVLLEPKIFQHFRA